MPSRAAAAALTLALAAVGCAGPQAVVGPRAGQGAARLGPLEDGPRVSPPPLAPEVEPVQSAAVSGDTLRSRLVRFASESHQARSAALVGDPVPVAQVARWEEVQTEVVRFLAGSATADDVSAVRALLRSVLDLDARVYEKLPGTLLEGVERRLAALDERFAAMNPAPARPGGYRWPLPTVRVTSRFGKRLHPIKGRWRLHTGVDLSAEAGEPVLAAGLGIVVRAGWNAGNGFEVEVQHPDGLLTRYSHLAAPLVLAWTSVQAGDPLGVAGRTGTATGVHLHFEFVRGGVPRDPLREFRKLVAAPAPRVVILAPQRHRAAQKGQAEHGVDPGA
jgi:murein DD-endopeptidase MepM/ murein hydrolase activator NlpD